MAKADLHVHSKYSDHPSEWFLQRIGTSESYTEPDFVYETAKERGMTYVTLTDHNKIDGALYLKDKYPQDFFTGVEVTTYFPEDKCKLHVLVYDLTEQQFQEIQRIRTSVYDLRDFIKEQYLAYSVAHATYAVNGKITLAHIEKCILLFDVFEGINGSRTYLSNSVLMDMLNALTPEYIERLYDVHKIEPMSDTPWIKGFTGGSDDHAGLYISKTYGESWASSMGEFVDNIKNRKTIANGRHNDFDGLAFAIYKIAYDFSRQKGKLTSSLIPQLNNIIFSNKKLSLRQRLNVFGMKARGDHKRDLVKSSLIQLIDTLKAINGHDIEERLDIVYDKISDISDAILGTIFNTITSKLKKGDLQGIVSSLSSAIPAVFLSVPFFSTLKHMYQGRALLNDMKKSVGISAKKDKTILWFTDTFTDLNGVAATLSETAQVAAGYGKNIIMVTSVSEEHAEGLPGNVINIPSIQSFKLPYYEKLTMRIPSVLKTVKKLIAYDPDEIFISSPGPIGLMGMFYARLVNLPCVNVYHTDFSLQAREITGDDSIADLVETFMKWYYSSSDEIRVLSDEYKNILIERGYPAEKMKKFIKSINVDFFKPRVIEEDFLKEKHGVDSGVNLLYAGRISRDKGIDFLYDIYRQVSQQRDNVNLIIVGDGPYLEEFKEKCSNNSNIYFTGRVERSQLPLYYSACDLFLFPSTTDTFGMVVLEAQACGLPAIVSDQGGPKEIINLNKSGYSLPANDQQIWCDHIDRFIHIILNDKKQYGDFAEYAAECAQKYSWKAFLDDIFAKKDNDSRDKLEMDSRHQDDEKIA